MWWRFRSGTGTMCRKASRLMGRGARGSYFEGVTPLPYLRSKSIFSTIYGDDYLLNRRRQGNPRQATKNKPSVEGCTKCIVPWYALMLAVSYVYNIALAQVHCFLSSESYRAGTILPSPLAILSSTSP